MNLHFSIEYHTEWGQHVAVEITATRNQGSKVNHLFPLETSDGYHWAADISLPEKDVQTFRYNYIICAGEQVIRREWDAVPRVFPAADLNFRLPDYWRDIPELNHLYSAAYCNAVSHFKAEVPKLVYFQQTLVFRVQAPQLKQGQVLALLGSQPPLGAWDTRRYLRMQRAGTNEWVISLSATGLYLPFEYKYVVVNEASGELLEWEGGPNRLSPSGLMQQRQVLVIQDTEVRLKADRWKAAGVVIPVFSLRSEQSQGVGDFSDLARMAKWAHSVGMTVVQLLPVNDTTQTGSWTDCYPYSSISIYALHPMYVDLQSLPPINDGGYMQEYEKRRRELNALPQVDYEAVNQLKHDYMRRLYNQIQRRLQQDEDYLQFCSANESWLVPYAAFCLLRDKYKTCDFTSWPRYSEYKAEEISMWAQKKRTELGYYMYVQYLLDKQLYKAATEAREMGVVLKGDIPIGISRCSVESWTEPHLFHLNGQAGAPPDDFSVNGQNWGFPTYNWEAMALEDYSWWKARFRKMARYFDAYRIDHVLGFFRIWDIPAHSVHGMLGHFSPSLPMSEEEISGFGFSFDAELHTEPFITDDILQDIFGNRAQQVAALYLDPQVGGHYTLKPAYATQRLVEAAFCEQKDDVALQIRDGLYQLISNVLFVPDTQLENHYHPRINAMDDFAFAYLSVQDQDAFRRLHEHYYYHRHNDFWYGEALKKLPALVASTQMLVCAEDLGMVPACVAPVMERLRILSLEIQAMPKRFGRRFGRLEENPYLSVCTLFTHDMPTLRQWWKQSPERAQAFYNQILLHDGEAPAEMPGWLAEEIIARHVYCPSMLCLLSLQDWLAMDDDLRNPNVEQERINVPSDPHHYWRYRMHLKLEQLMESKAFNARVNSLLGRGGRIQNSIKQ